MAGQPKLEKIRENFMFKLGFHPQPQYIPWFRLLESWPGVHRSSEIRLAYEGIY